MKKSYIHIANKLYHEPWLIRPSVHTTLTHQFEAHVMGRAQADFNGPDPEDEDKDTVPLPVVPSVAVVPVWGIIGKHLSQMEMDCGGCSLDVVATQLKQAASNPAVSSIVLWIASAGGTVTGVQEVAELIAEIDKTKPVYCFTDDQVCSAAYWLASQARAIYCTPSSCLGSVGCYIYLEDHSKALDMEGIRPNPIVSEGSPMKLAGASFKPLTDEERALFQSDVNSIYTKFVKAIQTKRSVQPDYLKGQVVDGEQAVNVGFADGLVMDIEQALEVITKA